MTAFNKNFEIGKFMRKVKNDFLADKKNWCDLKNFQFTNGFYSTYENKAYNKIHMEQYYILKFFPMYFQEYMYAYEIFLESYDKENLKVLSIGVGSGVDYYALKEVLNNKNISLDYTGVDIVDWKYRTSEINFIHTDILNLDKIYFEDVDLVVFPKSLIELEDNRLKYITESIKKTASKKLSFLNTYVKKGQKVSGVEEFKIINQGLVNSHYKLCEENDTERYYTDDDQRSKIDYPINYYDWKDELENYCSGCNQDQIDRCNIAQYPMLYQKHMAFNVLNYTNEGL